MDNALTPSAHSNQSNTAAAFAELRFDGPFWKYQQIILEVIEQQRDTDSKYHIVAPPGSGKTIVGLELIRRFRHPAVILAPTTTIQKQWHEKLSLFTNDPKWISQNVSMDPTNLANINIFTYQILSTPGENLAFIERIAVNRWIDDLISNDLVQAEEDALDRINLIRDSNPKMFRKEISKRYRRAKRKILQQGDFDGRELLHANARNLIERVISLGVRTIVLDECHHLLDYWAFILRELIKTLPEVRVIGLTATLPDPKNQSEYENYTTLVGEVDFEVPTPAVVKEGNLAPYRDLVYFCKPSPRERRYLEEIQMHFGDAVQHITETVLFQDWLWNTVIVRQSANVDTDGKQETYEEFFNREPALCVAGIKFFLANEISLPEDIVVIDEMRDSLNIDDWLTLLETFGNQVLKLSNDPEHREYFQELRRTLLSFGITISESGVRHQRSPGELVLTLSESKDDATVEILQAEAKAMGEKLRAVIIVDYERMNARSRQVKDVLDPDAGSAVRVFRRLIDDDMTNKLDPILVTGKIVLADADKRKEFEKSIKQWVQQNDAEFTWEWQSTQDKRILQLSGSGKQWRSRTYVSLVTYLFEHGITQCLVGTRGLLGEGWDSLTVNTLINLTAVTTRTGVRQIRGRSLRIDPAWPRKVAHNWDVVCYSSDFDKGDIDLKRFIARHQNIWGIVVLPKYADIINAARQASTSVKIGSPLQGRIVRGVSHVDIDLARELAFRSAKKISFQAYTQQMLQAVTERDKVYDLWEIGKDYSNFIYSATQLNSKDIKFVTVHKIEDSIDAMARRLLGSLIATVWIVWLRTFVEFSNTPLSLCSSLFIALGLGVLISVIFNMREILKVYRKTFKELPVDAILLDIANALLASLRETGLISRNLKDKYVRVATTPAGGFEVFLDYASPEDSNTFARAYRQLLGPIREARYLIERDSASLRNLIYRPLWLLVRKVTGLGKDAHAYHRVPDILATRRKRAELFSRHWRRYVGGGELIYTRDAKGRSILLKARSQYRQRVRQMAFEFWR